MPYDENDQTAEKSLTPSARALYAHREVILTTWARRVKAEVSTASQLRNPVIINTFPLFIERLAAALCQECGHETATESSTVAQEHGSERARVTRYGPEQIIQEYQILRDVVRTELRKLVVLTEQDERVIQKSFDKAIQESMISYFHVLAHIREQLVATLTHDLRNPIGAVKMASEIITDALQGEPTREALDDALDMAKRITKNAKRADRMIQDMLDASLVQVGEQPSVNVTKGDVEMVVREALGEQSSANAARLIAEVESVVGYWDLDALQRSVENLISNAFKYGDSRSAVTVRVKSCHERVMISVHNVGNPIPAENLESLFQVFRRAEAAKHSGKKGWGIGLALARTTAERMGGSIGIESSLENGTTFTIDIPVDARPFLELPMSGPLP
jgi:signal transduction histidine kinase